MSTITPGHVRAFQMVRSPLYTDNITLAPCTINGEPGVAVVALDQIDDERMAVMPLFVAITAGMDIDFPSQRRSDGGSGGGPTDPREAFEAAKAATAPVPV